MTRIDGDWLEAFDEAMLGLFAIDHADAGMGECSLECYSDLLTRGARSAFRKNHDLSNSAWRLATIDDCANTLPLVSYSRC